MRKAVVGIASCLALLAYGCGGSSESPRRSAAEVIREKCNLALDSADKVIRLSLQVPDFAGLLIEHQRDAFREGIRFWRDRDQQAARTVEDTAVVDEMGIDDIDRQIRELAAEYFDRVQACAPGHPVTEDWAA